MVPSKNNAAGVCWQAVVRWPCSQDWVWPCCSASAGILRSGTDGGYTSGACSADSALMLSKQGRIEVALHLGSAINQQHHHTSEMTLINSLHSFVTEQWEGGLHLHPWPTDHSCNVSAHKKQSIHECVYLYNPCGADVQSVPEAGFAGLGMRRR